MKRSGILARIGCEWTYEDDKTTKTDIRQTWRGDLWISANLFVEFGREVEDGLAGDRGPLSILGGQATRGEAGSRVFQLYLPVTWSGAKTRIAKRGFHRYGLHQPIGCRAKEIRGGRG